jgi:hypothetical protein
MSDQADLQGFPHMMDYNEIIQYLPLNSRKSNTSIPPTSGQSFKTGNIKFSLPLGGLLNAQSLTVQYTFTPTYTIKSTTGAGIANTQNGVVYMIGTPAYSPFKELTERIGNKQLSNTSNYNLCENLIQQTTLNSSEKYGLSNVLYGSTLYSESNSTDVDIDSLYIYSGTSYSFSFPIRAGILPNCRKYVPLNKSIELGFTLDTFDNITSKIISFRNAIGADYADVLTHEAVDASYEITD